jgi:hypothetical protein
MFNLIETPKSWTVNLMCFLPKWIYHFNLVGISTPLKYLSESQLGWWNSLYMGKNHVPNHQSVIMFFFDSNICGRAHFDPYRKKCTFEVKCIASSRLTDSTYWGVGRQHG